MGGLEHLLRNHLNFDDVSYVMFMDLGYGIRQNMITPFCNRAVNQEEEEKRWNRAMSQSRISVEWGIGRVKGLFKMLSNKENLKILLQPVAMYWFLGGTH